MDNILHTKWGTAKINNGYWRISSYKEGNRGKLLHRLIAAEYFGEWINDPDDFFDIHHLDGNKLNNCVLNLEPLPHDEHSQLHNKGKKLSDEHKQKISETLTGRKLSDEHKQKISENNARYWKGKTHSEDDKQKSITSVDIEKLEEKVKARGLKWLKFKKEDDKNENKD